LRSWHREALSLRQYSHYTRISNSSRPRLSVSITGLFRETKVLVLVLVLATKVLVLVLVLDTKVLVLVLVLVTKVLVNITV